MTVLTWLLWGVAFVLGVIAYIQDLSANRWRRVVLILLMVLFMVVSLSQKLLEWSQQRKAAEEFYSQEIVRVFQKDRSKNAMHFFTDRQGSKCVTFALEHEPIPNTVKLWEGGYAAPPITLAVSSNTVTFRYSAYTDYDQYRSNPLLYQMRYFPKKK